MMSDTTAPPGVDRLERREQRLDGLGPPQNPHRDLRHNGERAFGANDQSKKIRTRGVRKGSADLHEFAVWKHGFDAEDVMHGESVLQAMGAAGIFGDIATDRTDLLTRGIRRVVTAERRDLSRDLEIRHTWLDDDSLIGNVDVDDAVEA